MTREKLKVLIVDDSRIFRSIVEQSLAGEDDIEVIGSVRNGVKALEFIAERQPDLVTLDVEMPEMNGLETLECIQQRNAEHREHEPIGVIMVSSFTRKGADVTIEALEAGAFDFVAKPENREGAESGEVLRRQLCVKMRSFASRRTARRVSRGRGPARVMTAPERPPVAVRPRSPASQKGIRAILIGVSTGGPRALTELMPRLCEGIEVPIFIVQHMPPTFTESLAKSLDAKCRYTVVEARDQDEVAPRHAYIAPGGQHMVVRKRGSRVLTALNSQPPENGCRPAADVLFRSAAPVYRDGIVAAVLTGMGSDGTKGLAPLKRVGAYVIAQDEETSVVWGMPGSAVAAGHVDDVQPLGDIAVAIHDVMARAHGG